MNDKSSLHISGLSTYALYQFKDSLGRLSIDLRLLCKISNRRNMIRRRYPFEYGLSPDTLEKVTQWLTLRLRKIGLGNSGSTIYSYFWHKGTPYSTFITNYTYL